MFNPIRKYQQGGDTSEQLMQQIAQMLQQQVPPQKIMEQLQQMGVQPQQAQQMIQQVAQSMQQEQPQMQQGGKANPYIQPSNKLNPADFPPERTIEKREELYKGANPDMIIYQDTYGDGRKDITYQNRKTGQLMANPWATNKDNSINRTITGSLDIQNPKFVPMKSITKMKKGGMKKWNY